MTVNFKSFHQPTIDVKFLMNNYKPYLWTQSIFFIKKLFLLSYLHLCKIKKKCVCGTPTGKHFPTTSLISPSTQWSLQVPTSWLLPCVCSLKFPSINPSTFTRYKQGNKVYIFMCTGPAKKLTKSLITEMMLTQVVPIILITIM